MNQAIFHRVAARDEHDGNPLRGLFRAERDGGRECDQEISAIFLELRCCGLQCIYVAAALPTALSFTSSAFALNPQPEPPGIPAVVDGARKFAKFKQIKLPPDPCKLHYCR